MIRFQMKSRVALDVVDARHRRRPLRADFDRADALTRNHRGCIVKIQRMVGPGMPSRVERFGYQSMTDAIEAEVDEVTGQLMGIKCRKHAGAGRSRTRLA